VAHDERRPQSRDADLLARCRAGDARAWTALLDRYERLVFSIPLSYGLSRDEAAEVTQATFAELVRGLDGIELEDRLTAWLGTVAKRQTIRIFERLRRERAAASAAEHLVDPVGRHELDEERITDVEWVIQALALVPRRCRALLEALYFADGEPSYADVAARLGIPIGSIGPTRARCVAAMREALDRLHEDG